MEAVLPVRRSRIRDESVLPDTAPSGREWDVSVAVLGLSSQQARIVGLILEGKADKQIARELGIRSVPAVVISARSPSMSRPASPISAVLDWGATAANAATPLRLCSEKRTRSIAA